MGSAKHFTVYNQELNRYSYDAQISKRALNEIYARPFGDVIKNAGIASIMSSYNFASQ